MRMNVNATANARVMPRIRTRSRVGRSPTESDECATPHGDQECEEDRRGRVMIGPNRHANARRHEGTVTRRSVLRRQSEGQSEHTIDIAAPVARLKWYSN